MRVRLLLLAVASALLLPMAASAQNDVMPSDVDLKAAYCLGVVKARIAVFTSDPTAVQAQGAGADFLRAQIQSSQNDLQRLQSYLLPKTPYLDPTGLLVASNRGAADSQSGIRQVDVCQARCPSQNLESQQARDSWQACMSPCLEESSAVMGIRSCQKLSFLPF